MPVAAPESTLFDLLDEATAVGDGRLLVTSGLDQRSASVYVRDGKVVSVHVHGFAPKVARRFLTGGLIELHEYAQILDLVEGDDYSADAGELAVGLQYVDRAAVDAVYRELLLSAVGAVSRWEDMSGVFESGESTEHYLVPPVSVNAIRKALVKRTERWDEMWESMAPGVPVHEAFPTVVAHVAPDDELPAEVQAVLHASTGSLTLDEVAGECGLTRFETGHVLSQLVANGVMAIAHPTVDDYDQPVQPEQVVEADAEQDPDFVHAEDPEGAPDFPGDDQITQFAPDVQQAVAGATEVDAADDADEASEPGFGAVVEDVFPDGMDSGAMNTEDLNDDDLHDDSDVVDTVDVDDEGPVVLPPVLNRPAGAWGSPVADSDTVVAPPVEPSMVEPLSSVPVPPMPSFTAPIPPAPVAPVAAAAVMVPPAPVIPPAPPAPLMGEEPQLVLPPVEVDVEVPDHGDVDAPVPLPVPVEDTTPEPTVDAEDADVLDVDVLDVEVVEETDADPVENEAVAAVRQQVTLTQQAALEAGERKYRAMNRLRKAETEQARLQPLLDEARTVLADTEEPFAAATTAAADADVQLEDAAAKLREAEEAHRAATVAAEAAHARVNDLTVERESAETVVTETETLLEQANQHVDQFKGEVTDAVDAHDKAQADAEAALREYADLDDED